MKKSRQKLCGLFLNEHFDQFEKRQSEHETHEIQLILKKLEAMEQMEDSEGMRYNMTISIFEILEIFNQKIPFYETVWPFKEKERIIFENR